MLDSYLGCGLWVQRRDSSPRKEQCLCSMVPGSNYIIQMLWVCVNQGWGPLCDPRVVILKFCVCVCCLWRCFPGTQHQSTVIFLNTSHYHCTLAIHYLILSSTQSFLKSEIESHSVCIQIFAAPCTRVHGILQARILEWVVFPVSRESSKPRDQTQVARIAGRFFNN